MEILSPAGNFESAITAFKAGADAIYIGGKAFSARMSANNFSNDELKNIVDLAHSVLKKVYVTFNTLIYQDEFNEAIEFAKYLYAINVDAIIVQDLGLAYYLHQVLPKLTLHASTQLNCHNIDMAKALKRIGFTRIVIARECSFDLVRQIKAIGLEVEVFVHGALCVSYSGNCLLSSFIGGRSGNRGRCAQPCRMKYDYVEDGRKVTSNFFISTKDLCAIDELNRFVDSGTDSIKIEGRLKGNEYVYTSTLAYRHALDAINRNAKNLFLNEDKYKLSVCYSRKFSHGYVCNESPFKLLNQETNSHQGELIGKVIKVNKERVSIKLNKQIHRLDGIRFNNESQIGLTIERMFVNSKPRDIAYPNEIIEIVGVESAYKVNNADVIRTTNFALSKEIELDLMQKLKMPIEGTLYASIGKPLSLVTKINGQTLRVEGGVAEQAINKGTPLERIKEQMAKSGDYPYYFSNLEYIGPDCFISISNLNELRNNLYKLIFETLTNNNEVVLNEYKPERIVNAKPYEIKTIANKRLQKEFTEAFGLTCFSFWSKEHELHDRIELKPKFDSLEHLIGFPVFNENNKSYVASCYANITNSYSLDAYYALGFNECILSSELNFESIQYLLNDYYQRNSIYPNVGVVVYGKLDMMVMKSCPIGTYYKNSKTHCNICHEHKCFLIDKEGEHYSLVGDINCNLRILSNKPLYLVDKMKDLKDIHVSNMYFLFTGENRDEVDEILDLNHSNYSSKYARGHFIKRSL